MGNYVSSALSKTSSSSSSSAARVVLPDGEIRRIHAPTKAAELMTSAARVVLPDGEIRRIHAPTKAAELMMEIPSFFLVDSKSLKIGRKFNPLAADDDLQIRGCHVYIAFPMTRATSAANATDMTRLYVAAKKQQRRRIGFKSSGAGTVVKHCHNGRVSPDGEVEDVRMISAKSKLNLEDIEEFSAAEFMHRISISKSKKPKLETIAEESLS